MKKAKLEILKLWEQDRKELKLIAELPEEIICPECGSPIGYILKEYREQTQQREKEILEDEIKFLEKIRKRKHGNCDYLGLLKELKNERGNKCQICEKKSNQIHHIIPRRIGGSNNKDNLLLICNNCHRIIESLIYSSDIGKRRECGRRIQALKSQIQNYSQQNSNLETPNKKQNSADCKKEIPKIIELQEKRLKRRVEELELRDGKSFEESIKEINKNKKSKEKK